jgi:5-methylcytosine-specific restriction endonuclease McrA
MIPLSPSTRIKKKKELGNNASDMANLHPLCCRCIHAMLDPESGTAAKTMKYVLICINHLNFINTLIR